MKNQTENTNNADSKISHDDSIIHSQIHLKSVGIAVVVTILWSSSWVIIKFGLEEIPAMTFAGLRYSIASLVLLSFTFGKKRNRVIIHQQSKKWWMWIIAYGLIYIFLTQGTQFVALDLMPATTVSLMLNLTPIIVLFFSTLTLNEHISKRQILYIILVLIGLIAYFYPVNLIAEDYIGFIVILISLFANAASSLLGRAINRTKSAPALVVTSLSMTIGSVFLLGFGFLTEEITLLSITSIIYILWLAFFNTALAFTMWNHAMQNLRAVDTALINCLMLPQIVFLAIIFLGEIPSIIEWIGIGLVTIGVFMVQLNQAKRKSKDS